MTLKEFERNLESIGFRQVERDGSSTEWKRRATFWRSDTVHLRNSMGGAYVLHLGHRCAPRASKGLTGERWFEYVERDDKPIALAEAWDWFSNIGLKFLSSPRSRPLHEWQTEEGIHVIENGVGIEIPRIRHLP